MNSLSITRTVVLCSAALFSCILCNQSRSPSGPPLAGDLQEVSVTGDSLQLLWDAPLATPSGTTLESYEIFYRGHAAPVSGWTPLRCCADAVAQPPLLVLRGDTGPGQFDLAIRAVFSDGEKSSFHTSLDPTTYNPGGWYLSWR